MTEEKTKQHTEKENKKTETKMEEKMHQDSLESKVEHKPSERLDDKKELKEEKKLQTTNHKPQTKKYIAIAHGANLPISKKHGMFICNFIKNKPIDLAIFQLQEVISYKRAIPFKGEIPHRKGKGMMSGRYPINASKQFINLLKGLKGNVISSGMDLDKTRIYLGSTSWASRPQRAGGRRAKRSNVILKAKEFKFGGKQV